MNYDSYRSVIKTFSNEIDRLRASHDALLAAAKRIVANGSHSASDWKFVSELQAAIAKAEELAEHQ
jgi:hypothetical protein